MGLGVGIGVGTGIAVGVGVEVGMGVAVGVEVGSWVANRSQATKVSNRVVMIRGSVFTLFSRPHTVVAYQPSIIAEVRRPVSSSSGDREASNREFGQASGP